MSEIANKLFADKAGVLKTLDDIQALFGPNGEYWTKDEYKIPTGVEDIYAFCLSGAAKEVDGPFELAAYVAIDMAIRQEQGTPADLEVSVQGFLEDAIDDIDDADELSAAVDNYEQGEIVDNYGSDGIITNYNDTSADWPAIVRVLDRARDIVRSA